ncbi:MAG: phosphotransferase [Anaerolineales bacterium]|nr:phosphotransferase [Anaerolineales bacterium]
MTAEPSSDSRQRHQAEVIAFLRQRLSRSAWELSLPPHGAGQETYFARGGGQDCFIKLGAQLERCQVLSALGVAPPVILAGWLEDGTSILVQPRLEGSMPTRQEFPRYLDQFAATLGKTHHSEALKRLLPSRPTSQHKDAGLAVLQEIQQRWEMYRPAVPAWADYVDDKIAYLKAQTSQFQSSGLVASHNDVCNGNWLISKDGAIYLLDYESMSQDDPALDIGAILWWYYPPELRQAFVEAAGYGYDQEFRRRMRIRMAMHNLNIILPRQGSFDRFNPEQFDSSLEDFRAVVEGGENPQGYAG